MQTRTERSRSAFMMPDIVGFLLGSDSGGGLKSHRVCYKQSRWRGDEGSAATAAAGVKCPESE